MKPLFFVLILALSSTAYAGSSTCTNTSSLSWYQENPYETLTSSDCIVEATQADASTVSNTALAVDLPLAPSDGDKFVLKDLTPYSFDGCSTWYSDPSWGGDGNTYSGCQPGGFDFEGGGTHLVGNANDGYTQGYIVPEFYFASCDVGDVEPGTSPCGAGDLPYYYGDYPKKRYSVTATFNGDSGNWDVVYSAL